MPLPAPVFVVGDTHGHRDRLARLLRDAGLIDRADRWCGVDARLWLLGDLADRGPDGIGAIRLAMALERESGGAARCLLGNHEVLLVGVALHGDTRVWPDGMSFRRVWLANGGLPADLAALEPDELEWLRRLPPVALEGDTLLVHADTDLYLELGTTRGKLEAAVREVLRDGAPSRLGELLDVTSDRGAFRDPDRVERVLSALGGNRVVHGHTPIALVTEREPSEVTRPLVYADGRAINVDHCLFGGGGGFVLEL